MTKVVRMKQADGQGLEMKQFEDLFLPNVHGIDPERAIQYVGEFEFKKGDILFCSFPKSGYHWMTNMLWSLKTLDKTKRAIDNILEWGRPWVYEQQEDPRIIATHIKPGRLPLQCIADTKTKVVLMLRNPKDVIVSAYHHLRSAVMFQSKQTFDELFQSFIQGQNFHGSYFTYLGEWENVLKDTHAGKTDLNIEVFYYEEFIANPVENLARLNTFLGFGRDRNYMDKVLADTTLGALREQYGGVFRDRTNPTCSDDKGDSIIFRKGKVGDWKNYFTVAQSEIMDKKVQDTLRQGIINFKYEF